MEADAAYICVKSVAIHKITKTETNGNVNIDYDKTGKIVGIEILNTTEPYVMWLNEDD